MTFWARLKERLRAGEIATPPVTLTPLPVVAEYQVGERRPRQIVYSAGVGVDDEHWERHRRLRLCTCAQRHWRCPDCGAWVCPLRAPHVCGVASC